MNLGWPSNRDECAHPVIHQSTHDLPGNLALYNAVYQPISGDAAPRRSSRSIGMYGPTQRRQFRGRPLGLTSRIYPAFCMLLFQRAHRRFMHQPCSLAQLTFRPNWSSVLLPGRLTHLTRAINCRDLSHMVAGAASFLESLDSYALDAEARMPPALIQRLMASARHYEHLSHGFFYGPGSA